MVYASKSRTLINSHCDPLLTRLKRKAPLDHGSVAGICYYNENISGHHFLRL